jgi:hypothetical protein
MYNRNTFYCPSQWPSNLLQEIIFPLLINTEIVGLNPIQGMTSGSERHGDGIIPRQRRPTANKIL